MDAKKQTVKKVLKFNKKGVEEKKKKRKHLSSKKQVSFCGFFWNLELHICNLAEGTGTTFQARDVARKTLEGLRFRGVFH